MRVLHLEFESKPYALTDERILPLPDDVRACVVRILDIAMG